MTEEVLTPIEVLEIVYNLDESSSDSSSDNVSSSDSEIDDIAVADAFTSDENGDEEEILHRDFRWENMDNYTGHRKVVQLWFWTQKWCRKCDIVQYFELFFDKEVIQQIVWETNRFTEQYKNAWGNLFSFRSLVRSWPQF